MSDDKTKVGGQDRARINVHEPYELEDAAKSLGVSKDRVKEAVAAVGDRRAKVEYFLQSGERKSNR